VDRLNALQNIIKVPIKIISAEIPMGLSTFIIILYN